MDAVHVEPRNALYSAFEDAFKVLAHPADAGRALCVRVNPRALPGDFLDLQVPYAPKIDPVPPTAVG